MTRGPADRRSVPTATSDDKSVAIDEILQEVIRQRNAGAAIDDAAVEQQHSELMPELGERLRVLRGIEAAAQGAQQIKSSSDQELEIGSSELCQGILQSKLPGYELLESIHSGGQGMVFRAVQTTTKRMVAIKVLLYGPFASAQQRRRFAREVELISRLEHPHIVTLYDSGEVGGMHFFAMEFIEGLPIDDYALVYNLSVKTLVQLMIKVCDAVGHAHQRGVIHRDIKPSNVLVDADGQPHVLDFGLAKTLTGFTLGDNAPSVSMTGQVLGTLPYLSPEQATGSEQAIDVRTDIYSLGVLLYRLLTDAYPYPVDGTADEVRANITGFVPRPVRKTLRDERLESRFQPGDISPDLEAVVLKTLEKDKTRRYQSADALASDLRRYLSGEAVQARGSNRFYVFRKTAYKHRVGFSAAAAILLTIGAVIGVAAQLTLKAREAEATGALRADMARISTLSLLRRFQVIESTTRHQADAAALPAEYREEYAKRYDGPRLEPDEQFDALTADMPVNILEIAEDSAHPERELAERWFCVAAPRLEEMSKRLETSSFFFADAPDESRSYTRAATSPHLSGASRLCDAYLARARWHFDTGNLPAGVKDLLAMRRLAVDLGGALFSPHRSFGSYYRRGAYVVIMDAYRKMIQQSAGTRPLYEWALTDPAHSNASPCFLRELLDVTQVADDAAATDLESGNRFVDLDRFDALTGGSLTEWKVTTDDYRDAVAALSLAGIRRDVERFYDMQERWDSLTYLELCEAIESFEYALTDARARNPIFYNLSYAGNGHRATLFNKTVRRVVRLLAFATAYREREGQWPKSLRDAVPAAFSADLTDSVTGREFAYDVWKDMPRLRSVVFEEPLPEDRWLANRRFKPVHIQKPDRKRFTYFSFDVGE